MSEHEKSPDPQSVTPPYETLRLQLEIAQNERASLRRELAGNRERIREEVIIEFLNAINSADARYTLDELYKSVSRLRQMSRDELRKLPAPFQGMAANERNLLLAFERFGLKPFGNIGETFEFTPDKFDDFDLEWPPITQGETKTVEIVSPGWKYNDNLIFLPKVRAVE